MDANFTVEASDVGDLRQSVPDTYVLGGGLGGIQELMLSILRPDGKTQ